MSESNTVIPEEIRLVDNLYNKVISHKSCLVDGEPEIANKLHDRLVAEGWVFNRDIYSYCTKAIHEYNLKKDGWNVNIIAAWFLGYFVDVTVTRC